MDGSRGGGCSVINEVVRVLVREHARTENARTENREHENKERISTSAGANFNECKKHFQRVLDGISTIAGAWNEFQRVLERISTSVVANFNECWQEFQQVQERISQGMT